MICACTVWRNLKRICRSIAVFLFTRLLGQCLKRWINDAIVTCGLPHAVLTSESVRHVSCLPKQLVGLFVITLVKFRTPPCAREIRERSTHLQGSELTCPADDDEPANEPIIELADEPVDEFGDEHVEEPVEFQEEEQPAQNLHAAEIMLRRVHSNLGHPSRGLMLQPPS